MGYVVLLGIGILTLLIGLGIYHIGFQIFEEEEHFKIAVIAFFIFYAVVAITLKFFLPSIDNGETSKASLSSFSTLF